MFYKNSYNKKFLKGKIAEFIKSAPLELQELRTKISKALPPDRLAEFVRKNDNPSIESESEMLAELIRNIALQIGLLGTNSPVPDEFSKMIHRIIGNDIERLFQKNGILHDTKQTQTKG